MRRIQGLLAGAVLVLAAGCSALVPNSGDELVGRWEGTLLFESALTPIRLEVRRGADSALAGVLSAPELLVHEQPVDSIEWAAPRVRFAIRELGGRYRFEGFARAGRIVGRLTSPSLPVRAGAESSPKASLRRVRAAAPACSTERVMLETPTGAVAGTLRLPPDPPPHPGLVLLSGVVQPVPEQQAALADSFARAGWATFVVEPHDDAARTLDDLSAEAAAAVRGLAAHPRVNGRVGVLSLSYDAALVPRVADRAAPAFAVAVSAPGVPMRRVLAWQDSVHRRTREAVTPRWGAAEHTRDPAADWARLRLPLLLVHGDRDEEAPVDEGLRAAAAAARAGGANGSLRVFPGAGHDLRVRPRPGEPFDWPRAAPGYVDTLLAWTSRVVGLEARPAPPDTGVPTLRLRPGWR